MSTDSFISYDFNYPFLWFLDAAMPGLLKLVYNQDKLVISDEDRKLLKSIKKKRVILIANHPTTEDPPVAYSITLHMYSRANFMAAREVFDWGNGLVGKLIRSVGAYSVLAGSADRESVKLSRRIISQPESKLVLFPEGEPNCKENDNLLPFQSGVAQIAFWGYEDAVKKELGADVYILPCFIKYRMNNPVEQVKKDIDISLNTLEKKLGLEKTGKNVKQRLLSIGKQILLRFENDFGIQVSETQDFDYRIGRVRHHILDYVAEKTGIHKWDKTANAIEKLRRLLSTFEMVSVGIPDPKNELPSKELANWGRKICERIYDFISIQTPYITELASAERVYEWIYRFESEVLGYSYKRPHNAHISFAKPYNIKDLYPSYRKNKKQSVEDLLHNLKSDLHTLMKKEIEKSPPIFEDSHIF
ncbi:MAG: 1-acyl-sn-glycerol-3-phosphate acyltransferase [Leptospiraceae bacterium]|nr:1-acyl-sn-glycerol-3-phosphate acyltransferase [Leptospiraceae bacterium]